MSRRRKRWLLAAGNLAVVAGLLSALSFLPPDNSLLDVRQAGALKLCVGDSAPPFVQNDPGAPGYDVELVRMAAAEIGVPARVNVVASIGKDFNPRNWRVTRAQCNIIAGGVADTAQTRSFLQTIATQAETGWVGISRDGQLPDRGGTWAVWPGTSGLDRPALSAWLRRRGAGVRLVRSPEEVAALLDGGKVNGAIMERYQSASLDTSRYRVFWLPADSFSRYPMALGLWKGDQTLYRAVKAAVEAINTSGRMDVMRVRYGLGRPVGLAL